MPTALPGDPVRVQKHGREIEHRGQRDTAILIPGDGRIAGVVVFVAQRQIGHVTLKVFNDFRLRIGDHLGQSPAGVFVLQTETEACPAT